MRRMWMIALLALALTGCKTIADIKPDTIVDIPLHPTQVQTEEVTEMTGAATEPSTETVPDVEGTEPTQSATQPPRNNTGSGGKNSGGKKPGQGSGNSKPPATEPATAAPTQPATEPPTEAPTEVHTEPQSYDPSGYAPGSLDRAVAQAVNLRRQEGGLPPLTVDQRLCAIASVRAYESATVWGHTRPDGSDGVSVLYAYGYAHSWAAENLYFGTGGADAIVDKWMTSQPRKENILAEAAAVIGVGSYTSDDGLTYVAVLFAG